MNDLFNENSDNASSNIPLAEKLRPKNLKEVIGQSHLLSENGKLTKQLLKKQVKSCIFWGPPGCGKTTIAKLLAQDAGFEFKNISAVFSSVGELKKIFEEAKYLKNKGKDTLLFVDEIHHFNKSQQDSFLPFVENGTVILVGATTENPSFRLNSALLSRCHVYVLHRFSDEELEDILKRAEGFFDEKLPLKKDARDLLKKLSDGDGRYLLNMVEIIADVFGDKKNNIDKNEMLSAVQSRFSQYDKAGDSHYNLISAVHKSLRGSDVQAALYWVARMLVSGEDPHYILRRLTRFAAEDIGLADPNAVNIAVSCWNVYDKLGSPEGEIAIAELTVYLATAPKSNSLYTALGSAYAMAKKTGSLMPPKHILNAPTNLMKDLGYGKDYQYDHDTKNGFSGQNYFPDEVKREELYVPKDIGFEREVKKRIDYWNKLRNQKS